MLCSTEGGPNKNDNPAPGQDRPPRGQRPAQQSAAGRGLKAGEIVSPGPCTGLDAVAPGDRVRADFGVLGAVEILLE